MFRHIDVCLDQWYFTWLIAATYNAGFAQGLLRSMHLTHSLLRGLLLRRWLSASLHHLDRLIGVNTVDLDFTGFFWGKRRWRSWCHFCIISMFNTVFWFQLAAIHAATISGNWIFTLEVTDHHFWRGFRLLLDECATTVRACCSLQHIGASPMRKLTLILPGSSTFPLM